MKRYALYFGTLLAVLAAFLVSNLFLSSESSLRSNQRVKNTDRVSVTDVTEGSAASDGEPQKNGLLGQSPNTFAAVSNEDAVITPSMESQAISSNAINTDFVVGADYLEENFSRLVEEFRSGGGQIAYEKREEFQQFFYSQSQLLTGEISLDVLECGAKLCVAELRSGDSAALRTFMAGRKDWQEFASKAMIEFPTLQPHITRLVFSHDPEIKGITIPSNGR